MLVYWLVGLHYVTQSTSCTHCSLLYVLTVSSRRLSCNTWYRLSHVWERMSKDKCPERKLLFDRRDIDLSGILLELRNTSLTDRIHSCARCFKAFPIPHHETSVYGVAAWRQQFGFT
jgi:hypothetical protein